MLYPESTKVLQTGITVQLRVLRAIRLEARRLSSVHYFL